VIDLQREKPRPLRQACDHVPHRRRGRKLHVATLYRWWKDGLRGVHLEVVCLGGTPVTTVEALHRFFKALADAKCPPPPASGTAAPAVRPATARAASVAKQLRVEQELDRRLGPVDSVPA
jgi:hypothetical protein